MVMNIVRYSDLGTPPTIYTRLRELVDGGWICYGSDASDGRKRLVRLTDQATGVFSQMSRGVRALAVKSENGVYGTGSKDQDS